LNFLTDLILSAHIAIPTEAEPRHYGAVSRETMHNDLLLSNGFAGSSS